MNISTDVSIRPAVADDAATIASLIGELADYERLAHENHATAESVAKHLFGSRPYAETLIAETEGAVAGFALFFHNFSTFRAQPGIYLEDLFVRPMYRGRGIGKALLRRLAALALERGCGRLEWAVLDWNQPAINFYRSLGARPMDEWTIFRVDGKALTRLGTPV
jgi:GNAT superfamily N-acetyltransferase